MFEIFTQKQSEQTGEKFVFYSNQYDITPHDQEDYEGLNGTEYFHGGQAFRD